MNNTKDYFKDGLPIFDYLNNLRLKNKDYIMIAPSWNYDEKNFLNETCFNLIDNLIKNDQKVIFRPHMEHFKEIKKLSVKLKKFYF